MKKIKKYPKEYMNFLFISIVALLIGFAVGIFIAYSCSVTIPEENSTAEVKKAQYVLKESNPDASSLYRISFKDTPQRRMGKTYMIEGNFKNITEGKFVFVKLNFSLLDERGEQVGTLEAYKENLQPGEGWSFTAINPTDSDISNIGYEVILNNVTIVI